MSHTLTPHEAAALHHHALALRPDWTQNNPGQAWLKNLGGYTIPLARDYHHALAALTAYCLESKDGSLVKRTPNLYTQEGTHWDAVPSVPGVAAGARGPACEDHPTFDALNCRCCLADVKVGDRPRSMVGKHYTPGGAEHPHAA